MIGRKGWGAVDAFPRNIGQPRVLVVDFLQKEQEGGTNEEKSGYGVAAVAFGSRHNRRNVFGAGRVLDGL